MVKNGKKERYKTVWNDLPFVLIKKFFKNPQNPKPQPVLVANDCRRWGSVVRSDNTDLVQKDQRTWSIGRTWVEVTCLRMGWAFSGFLGAFHCPSCTAVQPASGWSGTNMSPAHSGSSLTPNLRPCLGLTQPGPSTALVLGPRTNRCSVPSQVRVFSHHVHLPSGRGLMTPWPNRRPWGAWVSPEGLFSEPAQTVLSARSIGPVATRGHQSPIISPTMSKWRPKFPPSQIQGASSAGK